MLSPTRDDPVTKLGLQLLKDNVGGVAPGPILLEPELPPVDVPADLGTEDGLKVVGPPLKAALTQCPLWLLAEW